MIFLNVSFGIFAFMPLGWVFMAFVILFESIIMTKLLTSKLFNANIYRSTAWTNIISGIFGIAGTLFLNGGWYLVVWFPWVSKHEINLSKGNALQFLVVYYLIAFVLTLALEILTNILFLRNAYSRKAIIKATVITNVLSYIAGTIVLYSYSFG